ncbi:MAG: hypothetical protein K5641_00645 [Lachnospiraceae bacterium]|nr:hypothetical protein [Lachnospiraceae bacterium]
MKLENWYRLSFFEQLSNIAAEVNRLVENEEQNDKQYESFYLDKIMELIDATFTDPKNDIRRKKELLDEYDQIKHYLNHEFDSKYILDYWDQYTRAIS